MLRNISNLGKSLNKAEQKSITGGMGKRKCCNPALACCVPRPVPVSCSGSGDPWCQYWYSNTGGCCI